MKLLFLTKKQKAKLERLVEGYPNVTKERLAHMHVANSYQICLRALILGIWYSFLFVTFAIGLYAEINLALALGR